MSLCGSYLEVLSSFLFDDYALFQFFTGVHLPGFFSLDGKSDEGEKDHHTHKFESLWNKATFT